MLDLTYIREVNLQNIRVNLIIHGREITELTAQLSKLKHARDGLS
jgi:hypothetical protein